MFFRQYDVFLSVVLYSLFSFSVIGVEDIFSVWASTDILLGEIPELALDSVSLVSSDCLGVVVKSHQSIKQ